MQRDDLVEERLQRPVTSTKAFKAREDIRSRLTRHARQHNPTVRPAVGDAVHLDDDGSGSLGQIKRPLRYTLDVFGTELDRHRQARVAHAEHSAPDAISGLQAQ